MVFQNDKQRKGFFARLEELKARHDKAREEKFNQRIAQERQELNELQKKAQERKLAQDVKLAKLRQINAQKEQIQHLKDEEKATRKAIFEASARGRALKKLKEGAIKAEKGAVKIATSKSTKKVLKGIGTELNKIISGKQTTRKKRIKHKRKIKRKIKKKTNKKQSKPKQIIIKVG